MSDLNMCTIAPLRKVVETPVYARTIVSTSNQIVDDHRDKRVYLSVTPHPQNDVEQFANRVAYVLGQQSKSLSQGSVYNFLHHAVGNTASLIFPYTPSINMNHNVSYEDSSIYHSNLQISHYKNTPPPQLNVSATFTADTIENAKNMLSAIWFLRAVTKCDFGLESQTPGLPPPILYFNGWNDTFDAIPVVITSFNETYPESEYYVSLGLNFANENFEWERTVAYNPCKCTCGMSSQSLTFGSGSDKTNNFKLKYWLPMEMKINIGMKIQYNIEKYVHQFDLNEYKMGVLGLSKNGSNVHTIVNGQQTITDNVFYSDDRYIEGMSSISQYRNQGSRSGGQYDKSGWTW